MIESMQLIMNDTKLKTIEQVRLFVGGEPRPGIETGQPRGEVSLGGIDIDAVSVW